MNSFCNECPERSEWQQMNESMKSGMTTRTCRKCFSEIDARAVKCLKCHSGQLTLRFVHFAIPVFVLAAFAAAIIWIEILAHHRDRPIGRDCAADIEVVSSRLFFVPHEESRRTVIVGLLKNVGETSINQTVLEVRITDADGSLIDTVTQYVHSDLPPGREVPFKLSASQNIHLPQSEYAHHLIIVRAANGKK